MVIKILGTGAKEGIPAAFCGCGICTAAAEVGGKEIRGRSCTLVGSRTLIDMSDDIFFHKIRHGIDLTKIENIIYTHSHNDHFSLSSLNTMLFKFADRCAKTVNIYGNRYVKELFDSAYGNCNEFNFTEIADGSSFVADGINFTAIETVHDAEENCLIYLLEKDGKTALFGHDSTVFRENIYETLQDCKPSLVILDCCHALAPPRTRHMNLDQCVGIKRKLLDRGIASPDTKFVITHITHKGQALHKDLSMAAEQENIIVAYDGIELKI